MERFGRYQIIRELGHGGMGVVYEAHDPQFDRPVALKVLLPKFAAEQELVDRFLAEGRMAAKLSHPNVVTVYDTGVQDSARYIVMEYVRGEDLRLLLQRQKRLPLARALSILRQVAAGLDAAHAAQIVHRDVKPANILVSEGGVVKVADFGIARALQETRHTRGGWVGTPGYMSPEQFTGGTIDARSDVYSLACVALEILTGVRGSEVTCVADAASPVAGEKKRVPGRRGNLKPAVYQVLDRGRDALPARRFATAGEFVAALEKAAGMGAARRSGLYVGTTAGMLATGAGVFALVYPGHLARPRPPVISSTMHQAALGRPFECRLTSTPDIPGMRWSATRVPAGLVLSEDGRLRGVLARSGVFPVEVTAHPPSGKPVRDRLILQVSTSAEAQDALRQARESYQAARTLGDDANAHQRAITAAEVARFEVLARKSAASARQARVLDPGLREAYLLEGDATHLLNGGPSDTTTRDRLSAILRAFHESFPADPEFERRVRICRKTWPEFR